MQEYISKDSKCLGCVRAMMRSVHHDKNAALKPCQMRTEQFPESAFCKRPFVFSELSSKDWQDIFQKYSYCRHFLQVVRRLPFLGFLR